MPKTAGKVATVYASVGAAWVLATDALFDPVGISAVQSGKGGLFVAATTAVLYWHLRRKMRQIKAHEAALAEALRRAEAHATSRNRLIGAISHDLRQPLQSLALFSSVLEGEQLSPRARAAVTGLSTSVGRISSVLDAILGVVRADQGETVRKQTVVLGDLLRELAAGMQPDAEAKGLKLRAAPTSATLETDPVLLVALLRQLVENAVRFTVTGGVLIGCRRSGGRLGIEVWDTGVGIPEDKLRLVFEEFYQLDNDARDFTLGLGLGLAVAERLARLLGFELKVQSRPGRGSCFRVLAPVSSADATPHGNS